MLDGKLDQAGPVVNIQLLHHVATVGLNRLDADVQPLSDLSVAESPGDQLQHLSFARREETQSIAVTLLSFCAPHIVADQDL